MAIVMQARMDTNPSRETNSAYQQIHGGAGNLIAGNGVLELSRALLGSAATSFLSAGSIVDKNTLFRHPSLGLQAVQAGGWPASTTSSTSTTTSESSPYQMVLSRPTQSLLNVEPKINSVSLLSTLGNKVATMTPETRNSTASLLGAGSDCAEYCQSVNKADEKGASVVVPCRARGMPKDHNTKTAFFVIPKDIAHGEGLRCSHAGCREKGIRFRYCSVCSVPVAKRNFSTRHHHGELLEQSIRQENGLVMRTEADEVLAKRRELILREKRGRVTSCSSSCCTTSSSCEGSTSSSSSSSYSDTESDCSSSSNKRRKTKKSSSASSQRNSTTKAEEDMDTYSRNYHQQWMELLEQRPRCGDELNAWLSKVTLLSEKMSSNPPLRAQVEYLHAAESL